MVRVWFMSDFLSISVYNNKKDDILDTTNLVYRPKLLALLPADSFFIYIQAILGFDSLLLQ